MRTVVDADGVEWRLTEIGGVGVGNWDTPQATHAIVVAAAGEQEVHISPPIGWESMSEAKLIVMIADAAQRTE